MHVETYLNVDLSSSAQVKIQVKFNLTFLKKKIKFLGSHVVVLTHEDLSVDVTITYVGLILTKPGRFCVLAYGNSGYGRTDRIQFRQFQTF